MVSEMRGGYGALGSVVETGFFTSGIALRASTREIS